MPWTERHFPDETPETDRLIDGFEDYSELCMINDILRMTERREQSTDPAAVIDTAAPL